MSLPVGTCSKDLQFHWVLCFCVPLMGKQSVALCYQGAAAGLPHQNNSCPCSYSWEIEIPECWFCRPSSIYFEFVPRVFLYFWLLCWQLHWHLCVWKVLFSRSKAPWNNAAHSLEVFMLFRTIYISSCLLFTLCIVPRLLENVILTSPLIKWDYSKSYGWCLGSFCLLWNGWMEKTSAGRWNPNLVYIMTKGAKSSPQLIFPIHGCVVTGIQ